MAWAAAEGVDLSNLIASTSSVAVDGAFIAFPGTRHTEIWCPSTGLIYARDATHARGAKYAWASLPRLREFGWQILGIRRTNVTTKARVQNQQSSARGTEEDPGYLLRGVFRSNNVASSSRTRILVDHSFNAGSKV